MEALKTRLRSLHLSAMVEGLDVRNQYALAHQTSYLEFLDLLVEDECARRQSNAYQTRLKESRLVTSKTLDSYEFPYQPQLDKRMIFELAACRFIDQRQNIVLMGKPGVGKTHLAHALGLEAIKKGKKVRFTHANELMERLFASRADGTYQYTLQKCMKPDLLIIDELGFKKMPQHGLDDFFEIIRRRYESGSMIITTNRNFEDWGNLFGDKVMASAIIDRIVHHAHIIKITGDSYRIKNLKELQQLFQEETPPAKRGRPRKLPEADEIKTPEENIEND